MIINNNHLMETGTSAESGVMDVFVTLTAALDHERDTKEACYE